MEEGREARQRGRGKVDVVVKVGGSAITNKSVRQSFNSATAQETAQLFKHLYTENTSAVLIHGAGSFGHFEAHEYKVSSGIDNSSEEGRLRSLMGFALTHNCVRRLQNLIVDSFCAAGVPAVGVSPFPFFLMKTEEEERVKKVEGKEYERESGMGFAVEEGKGTLERIEQLIDMGLLPVLHGDAVLDDTKQSLAKDNNARERRKGVSILGGDVIAEWLCEKVKPKRLVFLTDVPGILDQPPPLGKVVIPEIVVIPKPKREDTEGVQEYDISIQLPETSQLEHDVTGGIKAKLDSCIKVAAMGVEVFIVQVATPSALQACRGEKPAVGTYIHL